MDSCSKQTDLTSQKDTAEPPREARNKPSDDQTIIFPNRNNCVHCNIHLLSTELIPGKLAKRRKASCGVITFHEIVPTDLLHHTSPRSVEQKPSSSLLSSSLVACPYVRRVTQKPARVVTRHQTAADKDKAHTHSTCSVKHLQDRLLSERQEADAIAQPLLSVEDGFIKDLEHFLNYRDMLVVRKREFLHKRWMKCVWWPVQRSVQQCFLRRHYEGAEPTKVITTALKDPLFVYLRSRMEEKRVILHCQTGCMDDGQWMASAEEQSRNKRDQHRSSRGGGPVFLAAPDGRCYRPECWSGIGLSHRCSTES